VGANAPEGPETALKPLQRRKTMSDVKPIPDGCHTVNVYLIVPNAKEALEFYAKALGAETLMVMSTPDGRSTVHAEMRIGDSNIMLTDENPAWNAKSPKTLGGTPVSLHLYVEDCDALYDRAIEAGCESTMPVMDMFWGDRYGKFNDPYGHQWGVATHREDVSPEEMEKRSAEFFKQMAEGGGGCGGE